MFNLKILTWIFYGRTFYLKATLRVLEIWIINLNKDFFAFYGQIILMPIILMPIILMSSNSCTASNKCSPKTCFGNLEIYKKSKRVGANLLFCFCFPWLFSLKDDWCSALCLSCLCRPVLSLSCLLSLSRLCPAFVCLVLVVYLRRIFCLVSLLSCLRCMSWSCLWPFVSASGRVSVVLLLSFVLVSPCFVCLVHLKIVKWKRVSRSSSSLPFSLSCLGLMTNHWQRVSWFSCSCLAFVLVFCAVGPLCCFVLSHLVFSCIVEKICLLSLSPCLVFSCVSSLALSVLSVRLIFLWVRVLSCGVDGSVYLALVESSLLCPCFACYLQMARTCLGLVLVLSCIVIFLPLLRVFLYPVVFRWRQRVLSRLVIV